jgi:hypothetical protein
LEGIEIISKLTLPIAGAVIGLFIGLYSIFKDTAENNWRKQFRKQVRLGVIKNTLNHDDMMHIAERWFQDRKAILHSLRVMHSEAVSGEDTELAQNAQCIRDLIKHHQDKEPYAELPENISIQLNDISSQSSDLSITIAQLASSLSELYSTNQLKLSRQVKLTYLGAITGIIGILIGLAGLYLAFLSNA